MGVLRVETARPYDVHIGPGVSSALPGLIGADVERIAFIADERLESRASQLASLLSDVQYQVWTVPSGEAAKSAHVLTELWARLGQAGFTRSDLIIGVGGGATTDLAGFVAATWLRGVDFITVSTTVLGMVDAAVGGKTGIDTAEGKNLVGAFHEPLGVLCDTDDLQNLPIAEMRSGFAEIIKCGFIADPTILTDIERQPDVVAGPTHDLLVSLIERGVRVKADTVAADLKERTSTSVIGREALNYGHTLGHAIELHEHYQMRHGEAIAIGMVFAAELARLQDWIDEDLVERHRAIFEQIGLPIAYGREAWPQLRMAMQRDKKTRGNTLRFVALQHLAAPAILAAPHEDAVREAYRRISL